MEGSRVMECIDFFQNRKEKLKSLEILLNFFDNRHGKKGISMNALWGKMTDHADGCKRTVMK